jgi:hypothetical protein
VVGGDVVNRGDRTQDHASRVADRPGVDSEPARPAGLVVGEHPGPVHPFTIERALQRQLLDTQGPAVVAAQREPFRPLPQRDRLTVGAEKIP